MSDHLVRVGHLKALQLRNSWSDSELARQCRRTPQQVRSWFLPVGSQGFRSIGEKLARELEAALGLARYSLDDRSSSDIAASPRSEGAAPMAEGAKNLAREMPVLLWAQLETMLDSDNAALKARAPHLETFAPSSSRAKFVQMGDDSMEPEFNEHDHILFDPTEAPRAGDVVLVRIPSGEHFVRVFKPKTAHTFEAVAVNPHYQPISSTADQAEIRAVMIEHRRYRRSRS